MNPRLASLERIDEMVEAFYGKVPEALAVNGSLPICTVSGTILRREGQAFHTESRDPEAIRRAREGKRESVKYRSGMLYLRRAFRSFWCLPGLAELEIERRLSAMGWSTSLLAAARPSGSRRQVTQRRPPHRLRREGLLLARTAGGPLRWFQRIRDRS